MAEPWSGQSLQTLPTTVLSALGALGNEFLREWEAQDTRVTLFKILLLWLVLSVLGIQLAWGFYGSTVTGLYHRPGKQQQMNLSKPTGNKGRQQRGLQGHIPSLGSATAQALGQLQASPGCGLGGPQCLQCWAPAVLGLASISCRHWASEEFASTSLEDQNLRDASGRLTAHFWSWLSPVPLPVPLGYNPKQVFLPEKSETYQFWNL